MSRRVNLGSSGETPKKVTSFSIHAEPTTVPRASPGSVHKYSDYGLSPSASPSRAAISPENTELPKPALKAKSSYQHPNRDASPIPKSATMPPRAPSKSDVLQSPATIATKENTRLNAVDRSAVYKTETDGRPKTSRGKSCPSPDEFFDYVIPSPQKGSGRGIEDPATKALMDDYQTLFASMGMAPPPASAFGASAAGAKPSARSGAGVSEVQKLVIDEETESESESENESDESSGSGGASEGREEVDCDTDGSYFDGSGSGSGSEGEALPSSADRQRERETELLACWLFACAMKA